MFETVLSDQNFLEFGLITLQRSYGLSNMPRYCRKGRRIILFYRKSSKHGFCQKVELSYPQIAKSKNIMNSKNKQKL